MYSFSVVLEYVGPKWRTFVANMSIALFFTFAACILPWIAYFLADWRMTCITISVPLALAIAAPWLVPESARWLVSQGQVEKAIQILGKFERINGTKVPENVYQHFRVRVHSSFSLSACKKVVAKDLSAMGRADASFKCVCLSGL